MATVNNNGSATETEATAKSTAKAVAQSQQMYIQVSFDGKDRMVPFEFAGRGQQVLASKALGGTLVIEGNSILPEGISIPSPLLIGEVVWFDTNGGCVELGVIHPNYAHLDKQAISEIAGYTDSFIEGSNISHDHANELVGELITDLKKEVESLVPRNAINKFLKSEQQKATKSSNRELRARMLRARR